MQTNPTVLSQDIFIGATNDFFLRNRHGLHAAHRSKGFRRATTMNAFPVQQPSNWDVRVLPLERVRSPAALRHKD